MKRIQDEANSMLAERRQEYLAVVNKVTELEEANKELQGEVAAVKQGKEAAVKATEEAQQSLKDTKTKLKMRDTYCEELVSCHWYWVLMLPLVIDHDIPVLFFCWLFCSGKRCEAVEGGLSLGTNQGFAI